METNAQNESSNSPRKPNLWFDGFTTTNMVLSGLLAVTLIVVVVLSLLLLNQQKSDNTNKNANTNSTITNTPTISQSPTINPTNTTVPTQILWSYDGASWKSMSSNIPSCPNPLILESPVNISLATNILYPGQVRGGDYKPHGGFLFSGRKNTEITVTMPADAVLYRGARYMEAGEVQYLLDFIAPCGLFFRFDHLLTLSPKFQTYAEKLPSPSQSSATTILDPVFIPKGEIIATAVGFMKTNNVSVDFGVYDLRQQNEISRNTSWATSHSNKKELGFYGICWLDYLTNSSSVKSLPGSGTEGKKSDYCKN